MTLEQLEAASAAADLAADQAEDYAARRMHAYRKGVIKLEDTFMSASVADAKRAEASRLAMALVYARVDGRGIVG